MLDAGCGTGQVTASLLGRLPRGEDAVLSTATFHWVLDHDALFRNLSAVMRADAQLAALGGQGNIASIEAAMADMGEGVVGSKRFAGPGETRARLEASGFVDVETWLHDEPTPLPSEDLEPYLEAICLGDHVEGMNDVERRRFAHEVASRMPEPVIDYVRLNIRARTPRRRFR